MAIVSQTKITILATVDMFDVRGGFFSAELGTTLQTEEGFFWKCPNSLHWLCTALTRSLMMPVSSSGAWSPPPWPADPLDKPLNLSKTTQHLSLTTSLPITCFPQFAAPPAGLPSYMVRAHCNNVNDVNDGLIN